MTTSIYHLAEPAAWADARTRGTYAVSTRGLTLDDVGFIHCADAGQWPGVRAAFYADVTSDLVLLEVDPYLLTAPVVREVGNPGTGEEFPHVYGPLEVSAVIGTTVLRPPHSPQ
ncbi:MAG: DUF952 domain-containing protein [Lapillicoccus sp.]